MKPDKHTEESNLETLTDFWTIPNVKYRNGIYTVDLAKQLLDNGNSKVQEGWVEYSKQAKNNNNFYTGDLPLYHATFTTLFKNREGKQKNEIREIRRFLCSTFESKGILTLTRIEYNPRKDKVIHNFGMHDRYGCSENIVGPNEWVEHSSNKKLYKAILGTDKIKEIINVYGWGTERGAYLWRMHFKPEETYTGAVRLYTGYSRGVIINCTGDYPWDSYSSLGVRATRTEL